MLFSHKNSPKGDLLSKSPDKSSLCLRKEKVETQFEPTDPAVCRTCGACCAYCRILVDWTEVDDFAPGGIPAEMTIKLGEYLRIMAGTESPPVRCVALEGQIGHFVTCKIYDRRSTACRLFNPENEDGSPNAMCDEARRAHGLPPLPRSRMKK